MGGNMKSRKRRNVEGRVTGSSKYTWLQRKGRGIARKKKREGVRDSERENE
jgi:hypothetical protein